MARSCTVNTTSNPVNHRPKSALATGAVPALLVNFELDEELGFWTQHLNCSSEKLLAAVESVGPRVDHVTEYLRAGW
jgi:Protein of unknown function (DUF3606)